MEIQSIAQQLQQLPANHKVEKKSGSLKTMKTAKIVFAALAVCFAAMAAISISIGMPLLLSIITGTAALVSIIAFTILYCKNQSTARALSNNLENIEDLSHETQPQLADMSMKSEDFGGHVALADNLDEFPNLDNKKKPEFDTMLIELKNHNRYKALADTVLSLIPLDSEKLEFVKVIIGSKDSDDHKALANNLELFIPLDDGKKLEFAEMLIESEPLALRKAFDGSLVRLIPLDDGKKLEFAEMLKSNKCFYIFDEYLDLLIPEGEDEKQKLADMLIGSSGSCSYKALAKKLWKFSLSDEKKLEFAEMLIGLSDFGSHKILAKKLWKFSLSDEKKLEFAKMLIGLSDFGSHKILVESLCNFPTLPLERIKTLIDEMVKYSYDSKFTLISNFNSVVKQLEAVFKNSAETEKKQILIELKDIKVCMKKMDGEEDIFKKNFLALTTTSYFFEDQEKTVKRIKVQEITFKRKLVDYFISIKKLDKIILSQINLEAKKTIGNLSGKLKSVSDVFENAFDELGAE